MSEEETSKHISKDLDFSIPPYLPDNDIVRRDMWKMYNNIAEMDSQVGAVLKQLESDGLLENTIIFFYGDHGGPLPRQKRLIYDSGLKTPLIVRFPNKLNAGPIDEQLVSFIDLAPTLLSLIGVKPPEYMQGQAFLGEHKANERKYLHAAADRFDEITDVIRAVKDSQYKYIRNYRPEQGYYLPVAYREQIPTMQELLRLRDEGKLNAIQAQWFRESKPVDELFDCINDPHELNSLADDPAYKDKLNELSAEMDRWLEEIGDQPSLPEKDLIVKLWNGMDSQPATSEPIISYENGLITLGCATEGASIGYQVVGADGVVPRSWSVYQKPFAVSEDVTMLVRSHRIGFAPSKIVETTGSQTSNN
jgi:arylsulfatase A-like enzyme